MVILTVVLYAAVIVAALLLTGLILIQPSKSGGLGASFGGFGESVFGAQMGSHLSKMTVIFIAVFLGLALLLAVVVSRGGASAENRSLAEDLAVEQTVPSDTAE